MPPLSTRTLLSALICCVFSLPALAQEAFEPPPSPRTLPARMIGELHGDFVLTFAEDHLCPEGAGCVFGNGAGVGGTLWWRWNTGSAIGVGYDLWLLGGGGVFEFASLQFVRASVRQHLFPHSRLHPFIGTSLGLELFGDTFRASTVGVGVDLEGGFEVEINARLAFVAKLAVRLFTTSEFVSRHDGARRASGFGISGASALQFGLMIAAGP